MKRKNISLSYFINTQRLKNFETKYFQINALPYFTLSQLIRQHADTYEDWIAKIRGIILT